MNLEIITRQAVGTEQPAHILFIHGGFHAAWCWSENFLPWFAERGWTSHAVSLRGHGGSDGAARMSEWGLKDYEEDVLRAVAQIGAPLVLIGHSMGGVIAQRCWPKCGTASAMVLLASSPRRVSMSVLARLTMSKPAAVVLGQLLGDMERAKPAYLEFFFSPSIQAATRAHYARQLGTESARAVRELFSRSDLPVDICDRRAVLVIGGEKDWSIPLAEHQYLAETYRATLAVCPGAHDLMLDADWNVTATTIDRWLREVFVRNQLDQQESAQL